MYITAQQITIILTLCGCVVAYFGYKRLLKKDSDASIIAFAQLSAKVDLILQNITELNDMKERVIRCEDSTKSAHHRIDEILGVIKDD